MIDTDSLAGFDMTNATSARWISCGTLLTILGVLNQPVASAQAGNGVYWVCRTVDGPSTYWSDVIGPIPNPTTSWSVLVESFGKFLSDKYHVSRDHQPTCTRYGTSPTMAANIVKSATAISGGSGAILTGWKGDGAAPATPAPATSAAAAPDSAKPAGLVGHDGVTNGASVPVPGASYHCYYSIVLPSDTKHRTMYTDAPFQSDAPKDWLEFWWSEYVLTTYGISNPNNTENACEPLKGAVAAQQATITSEETSWKLHNYNIVPVTWALSKPVPADPIERSKQMQEARLERMQPGAHPVGYCAVPIAGADEKDIPVMYFSTFFSGQLREVSLPDNVALKAFRDFLEKKYGPVHHGIGNCTVYGTAVVAQQSMAAQRHQARKSVDTDWTRP